MKFNENDVTFYWLGDHVEGGADFNVSYQTFYVAHLCWTVDVRDRWRAHLTVGNSIHATLYDVQDRDRVFAWVRCQVREMEVTRRSHCDLRS